VWGAVATLPLVSAVVDAVAPVPVIAAGGIGDAPGVAAVLALGAQAAWLGRRFFLAEETAVHEDYRGRLIAAVETDGQSYADLYSAGQTLPTVRSATRLPRGGRPRAAPRWAVDRERARRSRAEPPLSQSLLTRPRCRSREPPGTSRRSRCGLDRAWRSRSADSQHPKSSPSSPPNSRLDLDHSASLSLPRALPRRRRACPASVARS
jgi:hypothetical protein